MSPSLSRRHPVVQRFRAVASRRDADWAILDGAHLLADALAAGIRVETVLSDGGSPALTGRARAAGATVFDGLPAGVLEAASPVRTPSGVVALAEVPLRPAERLFDDPDALLVGLVNVQDPGNVGAVIRSADALGASGVLTLDGSADPRGWKALRGAMGSTFRLPVATGTLAEVLPRARERGLRVAATVARGGRPLDLDALAPPLLLLLGNEGAGLDTPIAAAADCRVSIPMRAGVDSLNIATAAAVLLWEAARARTAAPAARP